MPLGSTDLLKSFHLRAIHSDDAQIDELLQSHCASRWEKVQVQGELGKLSSNHDFAPELFHYYLWRARNWTGNEVVELESKDEMLSHFGERTKITKLGEVMLYPAGANQWGQSLRLTHNNDFYLTPASQKFGVQSAYLPFALRQPISRGVGFFLYAEKYAVMLSLLLYKPSRDLEIQAVQQFYNDVVKTLSHYLQSLVRLCLLVYCDRLGSNGLLRFTLWLDHRIGGIRLSQDDIRRETPIKFLRDPKRNLLDVIASAYQCDDVIDFLKQVDVSKTYSSNEGWVKQIKSNRRVQERYVAAIAKYYRIESLEQKTAECIERSVESQLSNQKNKLIQGVKEPLMSEFQSKLITLNDVIDQQFFFNIPIYQRLYVWGKEQIHTLLDDIVAAWLEEKNEFYLGGTLVIERAVNGSEDMRYFDLIDGQQRFTTLWLISVVLKEHLAAYIQADTKQGKRLRISFQFDHK